MYIVIDTNIYFNNWFLRSPHFLLLSNFANNTNSRVLAPLVVCEELEHKYQIERSSLLSDAAKASRRFVELGMENPIGPFSVEKAYHFQDILATKFDRMTVLGYAKIPHQILVNKAISAKRPFRDKEKGYRDALIWHGLVDYLREQNNSDPVAFINNNASDFFEGKDPTSFALHRDLVEDLNAAGRRVSAFVLSSLPQKYGRSSL